MAVFVIGPPGNTFAKTVRAVSDNRRPATKRVYSQSGRFRELLRGLVGSLGMVKCTYKACPTFAERERGVYAALCKHRERSQRLASERSNVQSSRQRTNFYFTCMT